MLGDERVDLARDLGEVLAQVVGEDAREEARERRHAEALAQRAPRLGVRRVLREVSLLETEAVGDRRRRHLGGRAVAHGEVAVAELEVGGHGVREVPRDVGAGVHQVDLRQHADGAVALRVVLLDELEGGVGLQVHPRGAHHQDDRALLLDVPADHPLDLRLDVARLPLVGERRHREAGQIDEGEVRHVRRVDSEEDRLVRHALLRAGARRRLRLDRRADLRELRRRRVGALQRNRLGRSPHAGREAAKLGAHRRRVGRVDELQRERRARAHLLAEREDVRRHDPVEQRRLAARLRADDHEPRHLGLLNLALRRRRPEDALERVGDAQHLRAAAHRPQRPALLGRRRRRARQPLGRRTAHRDRAAHEVAPRRPDRRAADRAHLRRDAKRQRRRRGRLRERRHRGRPLEICAESGGRLR